MVKILNTKGFKLNTTLSAFLASGLLAACGGGGGGGTTAGPGGSATSQPIEVGASTLVTSVAPATYTGEEAMAFKLINAERSNCGFGLLAQNAALDAAATSHVAYTPLNSVAGDDLHAEVPGRPGFTGVNPTARAVAKGYTGSVGEVMAVGTGTTAVRTLLSAPYHLKGLMDGYRDIGIGMLASNVVNFDYFVAELGNQKGTIPQNMAAADVLTYPCNGTTGVNFQLRGEWPNPVPGRDLASNPIGTPIFIKVRDGNDLQITSASMINVATGENIVLRAPMGGANDPNKGYFKGSEAYVAPDGPLAKGTSYQSTVSGTNNGVTFSRTFTFTTGAGMN